MDDDLKAKLLDYMTGLEEATKAGKDFVVSNAPETVRQFLAWHFWSGIVFAVVMLFASGGIVQLYRWWWMYSETFTDTDAISPTRAIFGFVCVGAIVALVINSLLFATMSLKIAIAPNVFLIETIADLVKR